MLTITQHASREDCLRISGRMDLMKQIGFLLLCLCMLFPTGAQAASMMEVSYWEARAGSLGDVEVAGREEIGQMNAAIREKDTLSVDFSAYPEELSGDVVSSYIKEATPSADGLSELGKGGAVSRLTSEDVDELLALRNLEDVPAVVPVRYAVTVTRANLRFLPTDTAWVDASGVRKEDCLQGTAVDPAEPLAVLMDSDDKKFCFVQMRNYRGWVSKDDIAFTDRGTWMNYAAPSRFLVVTANLAMVDVGGRKEIFQMGSRIPLIDHAWQTWKISVPTADASRRLVEKRVSVPHDVKIFHEGWLSYTTNNIIRQSFRFLGDAYGWGGLDNSVDSSALAADVYRTVGIELPRDSARQELAMSHRVELPPILTEDERNSVIASAMPGSLLFQPGQVSVLLGTTHEGKPMVLQALYQCGASGLNGTEMQYPCRVLLSSLALLGDDGRTFCKRITSVGTMIP